MPNTSDKPADFINIGPMFMGCPAGGGVANPSMPFVNTMLHMT